MIAVDFFAGSGWGVACKRLGIDEKGVEIMPDAIATRELNGMETIFQDVWDGLGPYAAGLMPESYELGIFSPPCPTFSAAGRGDGRAALPLLRRLIEEDVYKRPMELRRLAQDHQIDDKTALVLTPLAYIWRDLPKYIVLEQVPTVQPLWDLYAQVLVEMGYSVETNILSSEQYGVPQTRRRSILVASRDPYVFARLPRPTHSKYWTRDPKKLDTGVPRWISMFEALGHRGEYLRSNYSTNSDYANPGKRLMDQPAPTITSKANRNKWDGERGLEPADAAVLQPFPGWGFTERPAMTVTGHGLVTRHPTGQKKAIVEGLEAGTFIPRPPFTLETARKDGPQREDYISLSDRYEPDAVNCSPGENATLQSYPEGFEFAGKRSSQFLQIGNAVPPLLAEAILRELVG